MPLIRKIITWALGLPIAAVIVALAVANRAPVRISGDPFSMDNPSISADLPLFVLLLGAMFAGVLIGGTIVWFSQGKWRRACREARSDAAIWRSEALRNQRRADESGPDDLAGGHRQITHREDHAGTA